MSSSGSYIGVEATPGPNDGVQLEVYSGPNQTGTVNIFWPGTYTPQDFAQYGLLGKMQSFRVSPYTKATFINMDGTVSSQNAYATGSFINGGSGIATIVVERCDWDCGGNYLMGEPPSTRREMFTSPSSSLWIILCLLLFISIIVIVLVQKTGLNNLLDTSGPSPASQTSRFSQTSGFSQP